MEIVCDPVYDHTAPHGRATSPTTARKGSAVSELIERDVEYTVDGVTMAGYFCAPQSDGRLPGVVLIHDAFGLNADFRATARRYAEAGRAVFAADVWGERRSPESGAEIMELIGSMTSDHDTWMARIGAAHTAAAEQQELDADAVATVGYCFGGSSALEYLRIGGRTRGVASIHAGLDLLTPGWDASNRDAQVLVCTGAEDPMATPPQWQALKGALTERGIHWELDLYSGAKHAFTDPKSDTLGMPAAAYDARAAARSWGSTDRFLDELLAQ